MAIYEVDPRDFAPRKTDGKVRPINGERMRGALDPQEEEESEHPERMQVLKMAVEEGLANGMADSALYQRLAAYFDETEHEKATPLRAQASR
jgi:hypothetical protein